MPKAERPPAAPARPAGLEGVARVVAVSSCKGGVGKSTVATNLAVALQQRDHRVGFADLDIYGPSAPTMLAVNERPRPGRDDRIAPVLAHGLEVMSMGFFLDDSAPVIWRGPMAMSATKQFLRGVAWNELDYLIVDLPPGTGDISLTLAQEIPIDGALVVTTPQDLALADVRRGIAMFERLNVPVLGLVQNMSGYVCPKCHRRDDLFGGGEGKRIERELGVPLLADLPITVALREGCDSGKPLVAGQPKHPLSLAFRELACAVEQALAAAAGVASVAEPTAIENDEEAGLLTVRWSDGVTTEYRLQGLRGWCPCAECQGHAGQRRFVRVDKPVLADTEGVGRYAVRLIWKDGHSTGMYPYAYLREIADYPECKPS